MKREVLLLSMALTIFVLSSAQASTPSPKPKPMAGMDMSAPTPPPISGTAAMMGGTIFDSAMPSAIADISLKDQNGKSFTLNATNQLLSCDNKQTSKLLLNRDNTIPTLAFLTRHGHQ